LVDIDLIRKNFEGLSPDLAQKLANIGQKTTLTTGQEILKEGQYIKVIPLKRRKIKVNKRWNSNKIN
jgi:hypothetical protein